MKKITALIAAVLLLASCSGGDTAYVKDLRKRGESDAEIKAYINYEKGRKNQPKGGYIDVTGRTVAEVAKERGLTLEEYLSEYDLPPDMPGLVSETEANYTIPVHRMLDMYGMSFESFKQMFDIPDGIDENSPWGIAIGEAPVGAYIDMYVGKDSLEKFKEQYDLPDSVENDTKWKEVREQVDAAKKKQRETQVEQTEE